MCDCFLPHSISQPFQACGLDDVYAASRSTRIVTKKKGDSFTHDQDQDQRMALVSEGKGVGRNLSSASRVNILR